MQTRTWSKARKAIGGELSEEASMDNMVDVTIPLDADVAKALESRARREAAGRYLSGLLKDGRAREILAEAIAEAKHEARASGLTDEDVDAELAAWRSKQRT